LPKHDCNTSIYNYIYLFVTDTNGCIASDFIEVSVEPCKFFLPNAFSPNTDGENDEFQINYYNIICLEYSLIVIYNLWGEKVFESTDVAKGWDGTFNGNKENPGVYTYYLEATLISGEVIRKKGSVSLIR
jgi:gliding motility-associated-like protein